MRLEHELWLDPRRFRLVCLPFDVYGLSRKAEREDVITRLAVVRRVRLTRARGGKQPGRSWQ